MIIGILKCETAPSSICDLMGDYDQLVANFINEVSIDIHVRYKTFDCVKQKFPNIRQIEHFDGWVITGSRHGVNESLPWIEHLLDLVRYIYDRCRKLVGICFGHQVIIKALGGKVIRNPSGWQLSTQRFKLNSVGQELFNQKKTLCLLSIHQDIVVDLGEQVALKSIGGNSNCPILGAYLPNRVLTIQGHPEYLPINVEVLLNRINIDQPEQLEKARLRLNQATDRLLVARTIIDFLQGN